MSQNNGKMIEELDMVKLEEEFGTMTDPNLIFEEGDHDHDHGC